MAFPVPAHLPRREDPRDVSTAILTKISETDLQSLDAALASSWVAELDETVVHIRSRIHERLHNDLSAFTGQLSSAESIQERLRTLKENVNALDSRIANPESGLVPTLIGALTRHSQLAQDALDATVKHDALAHLLKMKQQYEELKSLVQRGRLPEAVGASADLEATIQASPEPLSRTSVVSEMRRDLDATKARVEEQLNDAYLRSVVVMSSELTVRPSVQVRESETTLALGSVLSSLTGASLAEHLTRLRRDLTSHYFEFIVKQPGTLELSSVGTITETAEYKLTLVLSPPNNQDPAARLHDLSTVLAFLSEHLFPHLPSTERKSFPLSLCRPIRVALLNHLLIPSLPSSLDGLPHFLDLLHKARKFEMDYLCSMLGDDGGEQEIKDWANGVGLHYERKRRMQLLEFVRLTIMGPEDENKMFFVDIEIKPEYGMKDPTVPAEPLFEPSKEQGDAAWDFEDEEPSQSQGLEDVPAPVTDTDEDAWGFGDEVEPDPQPTQNGLPYLSGPEEADGWGWNDDDASETLNGNEDDPWNDGWEDNPDQAKRTQVPKPANGLAKLTLKGKSPGMKADDSVIWSPMPIAPPPPTPSVPALPQQTQNAPVVMKESYMVSGRTKQLIQHVESILREGAELVSSGLLSAHQSATLPPGSVILQAASLTLDLFRAVYPVTFSTVLENSPKAAMRFSNDCVYLSTEVDRVRHTLRGAALLVADKLEECSDCLKLFGESWYADTIDRQCQVLNELLDKASGFADTMMQDSYDECECAVSQVLQRVRRLSQEWRRILNKSKYYDALGFVVDAALSRILADILALPDITEEESHRLSELCRILNALEGLFSEDPSQPSFVVSYVPSWLKFSYLSELLEASMADITYLFEEGALVDFDIEELVKLVRALFADTPLRSSTITKFHRGHPTTLS